MYTSSMAGFDLIHSNRGVFIHTGAKDQFRTLDCLFHTVQVNF